jgi:hypothetical protein
MGPGRTGVKGVIRDRDEAAEIRREKKAREIEEVRKKMEASSLGGKTFLEDERERAAKGEKVDGLVMSELDKKENKRNVSGRKRGGKFGHLREVGLKGFLGAVENEDNSVWVVVHLYDPVNVLSLCPQLCPLTSLFTVTRTLLPCRRKLGTTSTVFLGYKIPQSKSFCFRFCYNKVIQ